MKLRIWIENELCQTCYYYIFVFDPENVVIPSFFKFELRDSLFIITIRYKIIIDIISIYIMQKKFNTVMVLKQPIAVRFISLAKQ